MLRDLQRVFRESLNAFRAELGKREPEDEVTELLSAMRREMVEARAMLPKLREDAAKVESELTRERQLLADCERRGAAAERIGDGETARVASEFAERHRGRVQVLERKLEAARAEVELRARESEEMMRKYKEAEANRFALLAQLRRVRARDDMRGALDDETGAFADFKRMEDAVEDGAGYADALEELGGEEAPRPSRPSNAEVDARLEELKRRMRGN